MYSKFLKVLLSLSVFTSLGFFVSETNVYANESFSSELVNDNELPKEPIYDDEFPLETDNEDVVEVNLEGYEKYIISDGETYIFDLALAQENNESSEMLEFGVVFNSLAYEYEQDPEEASQIVTMGIVEVTKYGNWCGNGNNGKAPMDSLDLACKNHDKCWEKNGRGNKACNRTFVNQLKGIKSSGYSSRLGVHGRVYLNAAIALFSRFM